MTNLEPKYALHVLDEVEGVAAVTLTNILREAVAPKLLATVRPASSISSV